MSADWVRDAKRLAKRDGVQAALVAMSRALECVEAADRLVAAMDPREDYANDREAAQAVGDALAAYLKARGEG